jgi:hypothetical protein
MRNCIFLFFVIIICRHVDAQLVEIIIPGSVNNYESKAKIFGATLYLVQDGVTLSKSITTNTGAYNIVAKLNTSLPFELIVSKPNHITKKVYFDFKNITTKGQDISVQAVEELIVELFAVKQGLTITIGPTDYAEKFTWDNDQKIAIPDVQYKKLSIEKIINLYKEAELAALLSILESKATASAQSKNYKNAIAYADSALALKQNDSTFLKKKVLYQNALASKLADEKNIEDIKSLISSGDSLIMLVKYPEASLKFNEVLKKDPLNISAKKKLDNIAALTAIEVSQASDAKELVRLLANANKLEVNAKFSDAIIELNKTFKLSMPAAEKLKIELYISDLKLKIKNTDVVTLIGKELKVAKQFDNAKDFNNSKGSYLKINEYISLLDTTNATKQTQIYTKQIDESIGIALKSANELNSKDDYDKAIAAYKKTELLISVLLDVNKKNMKLAEVKEHIAEVEQKRKDKDKLYRDAIVKVTAAIDGGPKTFYIADDLFSKDPLKSKVNEKEIIDLKSRYTLVKNYFKDKNVKLKTVWLTDSIKAYQAIKEIYNLALTSKVSQNELNKVMVSMDSLSSIISPKKLKINSNSSGTILTAPGILVDTSNANASFQRLEFTRLSVEKGKNSYLVDLKNDIELESYFRNMQQDAIRNESATIIQNSLTENDVINQLKNNESNLRAEALKVLVQENDYIIYQRELAASLVNESAASIIQSDKNKMDAYLLKEKEREDSIHGLAQQILKVNMNAIDLKNVDLAKSNDLSASNLQKAKNKVELEIYRRDSLSKVSKELTAKNLVDQSNYVESSVRNPNYIRDEKGVCFPWNAVTEKIYEIKNSNGFVVAVIIRKVVVDQYGYGVVFEHTRNEKGISSFTLNGSNITEFIWFNQSNGSGVIIPNLTVVTKC